MDDNKFNFLTSEKPKGSQIKYVGPNIASTLKMTPKKFANSVLEVYKRIGGTSWLMTQAQADPKSFLDLLKRLIPKSVQLDDLEGVQINLIDQFGNTVEIQMNNAQSLPINEDIVCLPQSTKNKIATSGNPPKSEIDITNIFE